MVYRIVDIVEHRTFGIQSHILPDTVEHHHLVVDGVTDDGQDSRNERLVHLHAEGQDAVEQGKDTDGQECIVGEGDDAAGTPLPSAEADDDIDTDGEKADEYRDERVTGNVARHARAHHVGGDDTVGIGRRRMELFERQRRSKKRCKRLVHQPLYRGIRILTVIIVFVLRSNALLHLRFRAELFHLKALVGSIALHVVRHESLVERIADVVVGDDLVEPYHEGTASGELHAVVEAAGH